MTVCDFLEAFQKSANNRIVGRLKSRDMIDGSDVYVFEEQAKTNSRGGLRYWQTEDGVLVKANTVSVATRAEVYAGMLEKSCASLYARQGYSSAACPPTHPTSHSILHRFEASLPSFFCLDAKDHYYISNLHRQTLHHNRSQKDLCLSNRSLLFVPSTSSRCYQGILIATNTLAIHKRRHQPNEQGIP